MDVTCPYCDKKFNVWEHKDWDEGGWEMQCPHCGETVVISITDTEYSYEASKDC